MTSKATFPIGLTIIGIVTIALFYLFPKLILWTLLACIIGTFLFILVVVRRPEDMPKDLTDDESYDVY